MKVIHGIKNIFLLTITLLTCCNCSKENDSVTFDLTGSWVVIHYIEGNKKILKTEDNTWPDINNGDITINFTETEQSGAGMVSGVTVTNRYNGSYTVGNNGALSIGPIMTTFINEPEWTSLFRINQVTNYRIKNSRLYLTYNEGNNAIVLERN